MAPPSGAGKRVKGVQIYRPFVYGTTARPFDDKKNPKPPGVPDDHTHSWTVFVKGVDDADVTYWLRRVQFKLHESIPNPVRTIEGQKGKPFEVHETGWGEFEIAIKLYYVSESAEKPQTLYHHLRLHPYGNSEEEKEVMRASGQIPSWAYDEQIFNEPYEPFYETLTSGALPAPPGAPKSAGGKGGKSKEKASQPSTTPGGVLERSALIPEKTRPGQPFSKEMEALEIKKLREAQVKVADMAKKLAEELKEKEEQLRALKVSAAN